MPARLAVLICALGAIALVIGALTLPSLTAAEPRPELANALNQTSAAPANLEDAPSLYDAIESLIAGIRQAFAILDRYMLAALDNAASPGPDPSESKPAGGVDSVHEEIAAALKPAEQDQPAVSEQAADLQEAIRKQVQSQIDRALTETEASTAAPATDTPGCVTQHDAGPGWVQSTVHCFQQNVSSNGSSSSSMQVTSTSISSSSTNSSDSR